MVPVGDFWGGLTFGPCWVACGLPAPCAFGILWGWNIRAVRRGGVPAVRGRTLVFSMARVSTQFLLRPPYTRLWDRIPRVLWDTLADESISPRQTDGELLVLMCLRHGTAGEGRQLGAPIRSTPGTLGHSGGPGGPSGTDGYFNGLAAAGRLPQPLSAGGPGRPLG